MRKRLPAVSMTLQRWGYPKFRGRGPIFEGSWRLQLDPRYTAFKDKAPWNRSLVEGHPEVALILDKARGLFFCGRRGSLGAGVRLVHLGPDPN